MSVPSLTRMSLPVTFNHLSASNVMASNRSGAVKPLPSRARIPNMASVPQVQETNPPATKVNVDSAALF
jgi:hypothetical protein